MKRYRNEWKYHIRNVEIASIQSRLEAIMECDKNGNKGNYLVRSLYFDDYEDSCLKDNEGGEAVRFKYRIRYYGDDTSFIRLERKEKRNALCYKESCKITLDEYSSILLGNVNELVYSTDKVLLKKFCIEIMSKGFRPKVIIEYERVAYVEPITNIRITIDKNISASNDFDEFINGDYYKCPIMEKDKHVLEVKFDDILPSNYKGVIESIGLVQTSNSKYGMGRKIISNYYC